MQLSQTDQRADSTHEQKKFLRTHYSKIRKELGGQERDRQSSSLVRTASSLPEFKNCKMLLCYYPIGNEPSILPLAKLAIDMGKTLAFPISDTQTHTLSFRVVTSLDQLKLGAYNICEPTDDLPEISDTSEAICIVPALAFDLNGYRLGYGKGFYDRFLSNFCGISIGLTYTQSLTQILPHDATDLPVDIIITQGRVYNVKRSTEKQAKI